MKYYGQFLEVKGDGSVDDMLGSDSVRVLDGRWNLESMMNFMWEEKAKHRLSQHIVGFEIRRSIRGFSNYRTVHTTTIADRLLRE